MANANDSGYRARLIEGDRVEISAGNRVLSVARWTGSTVVDCAPPLPESGERTAEIFAALAVQIDSEIVAAWQALPPPCDDAGVDLTLIDWMLSLSPTQRLAALQDAASTFDALADHGDPVR